MIVCRSDSNFIMGTGLNSCGKVGALVMDDMQKTVAWEEWTVQSDRQKVMLGFMSGGLCDGR
jgi:hypothetical protein